MHLQTEIDEIKLNIPKKIAMKMEKAKQLAEDQELDEKDRKKASGSSCSIS